MRAMLDKVKRALRLTVNVYDQELSAMIKAALADLRLVGVAHHKLSEVKQDPLVTQAVVTYCRAHFGSPADYDKLKASYDEQKAQLMIAHDYVEVTDDDC